MRGNYKAGKACICILTVLLLASLSAGERHATPAGCWSPAGDGIHASGDTGPGDTPQVEDRTRDVKILGLLPIFPQRHLRHVDIVSTTFWETSTEPSVLHVSLELRGLKESTSMFEAVYAVSWTYSNLHYSTLLHIRPDGVHDFLVGRSIDGDDDVDQWDICQGTLDLDADLLTWKLPKTAVGDPPVGGQLHNIHPHTHLRPTADAWMPPIDLFKDLSHNARNTAIYTVRY